MFPVRYLIKLYLATSEVHLSPHSRVASPCDGLFGFTGQKCRLFWAFHTTWQLCGRRTLPYIVVCTVCLSSFSPSQRTDLALWANNSCSRPRLSSYLLTQIFSLIKPCMFHLDWEESYPKRPCISSLIYSWVIGQGGQVSLASCEHTVAPGSKPKLFQVRSSLQGERLASKKTIPLG